MRWWIDMRPWEDGGLSSSERETRRFYLTTGAFMLGALALLGGALAISINQCAAVCTADDRFGDYRTEGGCWCVDEEGRAFRPKPRRTS